MQDYTGQVRPPSNTATTADRRPTQRPRARPHLLGAIALGPPRRLCGANGGGARPDRALPLGNRLQTRNPRCRQAAVCTFCAHRAVPTTMSRHRS